MKEVKEGNEVKQEEILEQVRVMQSGNWRGQQEGGAEVFIKLLENKNSIIKVQKSGA